MDFLTLPLSVEKGRLNRESDVRRSIDSSLRLLISASRQSCVADPEYGFVFNNFRFNIFNENEGIIFDSKPQVTFDYETGMYNRKLSGKSQNVNTFAAELNETIRRYETRLKDVKTSMTYQRDEKMVYITVKGVISSSGEDYSFSTTIKAWN